MIKITSAIVSIVPDCLVSNVIDRVIRLIRAIRD
jgi:hypothetical protein